MESQPDTSYGLFGTEVLLKHLQALTQEIEGVRQAQDIECIHKMRVASRRLRSALALFQDSLPPKKFPVWQKQVRRITRALGAARDTDVQIDFLVQFLGNLADVEAAPGVPAYHVGVERLVLRLRQRRAQLQADVMSALDRFESSRLADEMGLWLRQNLVRARLNHTSARSPYVYAQAYTTISLRLEEFLAYESYVYRPECVAELHASRIAAKRLRYTMEAFAPLYPDELQEPLRAARDVQDMAGEIHDCDVWVQYLPQFLEQERQRTLEYFGHTRPFRRFVPGILYLQQDRQQRRARRYREFIKFWQQAAQEGGVWQNLRQTLQAGLAEPRPAQAEETGDARPDDADSQREQLVEPKGV